MLKISRSQNGRRAITLKLEGRIVDPWTTELLQSCESFLSRKAPLALDLAEVSFLDHEAAVALYSLQGRGVKLLNASPFIHEQLKSV